MSQRRYASGPDIGYLMLRQLGDILDELSVQGLAIWIDPETGWWWHWEGTPLWSKRRFWALGEAFIDAMIARYPTVFGGELPNDFCD